MNMNPWMAEQLVSDRMNDLERAADAHRHLPTNTAEAFVSPAPLRTRPAFARHVGVLLIAVGRRLAEPDSFPTLGASHHH